MQIQPYQPSPQTQAELVDLVDYCQNKEARLGIRMAEQPDLFDIPAHYQAAGQFFVAQADGHVAGCIALLPVAKDTAVLKKFFTYPEFRGEPHHLGARLFEQFLAFANAHGFQRIVLDTPEAEHRSHQFYEHHGFVRIDAEQLGVRYDFPDRDSRFYQLVL